MIAVCISTYGSDDWKDLAVTRALPSAQRENPVELVMRHDPDGTIASVRNEAAAKTTSPFLLWLDADDELSPRYLHAMNQAIERHGSNRRVLYTPAVAYVKNGRPQRPRFWPECRMQDGNWLVIGTVVSRELFDEVGGFKDYGDPPGSNAFEDWSVWARCVEAGATIVKVPRAVYVAHVDRASRHRRAPGLVQQAWHREIQADIWPDVYGPDAPAPPSVQAPSRSRRRVRR